jgi:hypothetical protein
MEGDASAPPWSHHDSDTPHDKFTIYNIKKMNE